MRRLCLIFLALILPILAVYGQPETLPQLHAGEHFIYDASGRVVLLRGANVPGHNAYPFYFGSQDLDALQSFGFNFIRLGISWEIAEPQPGQCRQDYIDAIVAFARAAGERGIYVMPEVHQIGWGAPGSGIPAWSLGRPVKSGGDLLGLAREANRFFRDPALQQKMIGFWIYLSKNLSGLPNLLGYEILNEPVSTDCLVYGCFEKKLFPFYERTISALRASDPQTAIIIEPCVFAIMFPAATAPFSQSNLIYSPHPYFLHLYSSSGKLIVLEREPNWELAEKYSRHIYEASQIPAPLLIGEFGAPEGHKFAEKWLEENYRLQDQYFLGSSIWVYDTKDDGWSIVDKNRKPRPFKWQVVHRPYPRFTAGTPLELRFSPEDKKFHYRFQPDPKIQSPTEIYIPKEFMANASLKVSAGKWNYDEKRELLFIENAGAESQIAVELKY